MKSGQYYDLERRGFIKPDEREPCIDGFGFYIDAYRELSTSRPVGLEIQAIPFTAIADYFRIYELRDFDEFAYIMRLMDSTFMELSESARKAEGNKDASGNTNKAHSNKR